MLNETLLLHSGKLRIVVPRPSYLQVALVIPIQYNLREGSIFESIELISDTPLPDCHQLGLYRIDYGLKQLAVFYTEQIISCQPEKSSNGGLSEVDVLLLISLLGGCVALIVVFMVTPLPHWVRYTCSILPIHALITNLYRSFCLQPLSARFAPSYPCFAYPRALKPCL